MVTAGFKITRFIASEAEGSDISSPGSGSGYSELLERELARLGTRGGTLQLDAEALRDLAEFLDTMVYANEDYPSRAASCRLHAERALALAQKLEEEGNG